jgi:hypothetical protein
MVSSIPGKAMGGLLVVLVPLLASCNPVQSAPEGIVVRLVDTATVPVISLPTYAADLSLTAPTDLATPTPTDSEVRTKTPDPNLRPSPTATRRPGAGPEVTATAASAGAALDTRAHGVVAAFHLEAAQATYQPGERVWFAFTLTNLKEMPLDYGAVGVILPDGSFHTSLSASSLAAQETLPWRDWVSFSELGQQTLVLAMCLSPKAVCLGGGQWVNLSAPVPVMIQ